MNNSSIYAAIKKIRQLFSREEKIRCLWIAGFSVFVSLLELVTASLIVVFAQVLNKPELGLNYFHKFGINVSYSTSKVVLVIAMVVGLSYLIKNIVSAVEMLFQNFTIQKMNYNFKNKMLHRYANSDYAFYLTRNAQFGVTLISSDVDNIYTNGVVSLASALSESLIFISLVGMIVYMNPSLALMLFGVSLILGLVITKSLLPRFYRWGKHLQDASLSAALYLLQFFHAFKEIVLLGKQEYFINQYKSHSKKKSTTLAIKTAIAAFPRMLIEILFIGLFVLAIAFMCSNYNSPAQMMGALSVYLYAGFRLMPGLNRMITYLTNFKSTIPSIERVYSECFTLVTNDNFIDLPEFQFLKSITLNGLDYTYFGSSRKVLNKVSLHISKGESIGIIGETGSGKSTLIDVILGLLNPVNGSVVIDGKYSVKTCQWHNLIGYVPQSVYLADGTIEENIAFGENYVDQACLNFAIDTAQLRKYIDSLPKGVKTWVGERGIRLSGGERQRIAIARCLYRNPEVLIFDEATSALDTTTENHLMNTINILCQNRTVIMVAHRLTTLKNCNRIVVIEDGKIKEITTYDDINNKVKNYA